MKLHLEHHSFLHWAVVGFIVLFIAGIAIQSVLLSLVLLGDRSSMEFSTKYVQLIYMSGLAGLAISLLYSILANKNLDE